MLLPNGVMVCRNNKKFKNEIPDKFVDTELKNYIENLSGNKSFKKEFKKNDKNKE